MATVTGYTADKMNELLANGIINASVDGNKHLILTTRDGTVIDAGPVGGNTTIVGRQVGEPVFWLAPLTAAIPNGFLLLEGGTASRTTYADLWALWGTTYGAGDGSTTFGLPNMKGRSPFGYDSTVPEFNAIGKSAGETVHLLSASESGVPAHNHAQSPHNHTQDAHNHTQNAHGHEVALNVNNNYGQDIPMLQEKGAVSYSGWTFGVDGTAGGLRRIVAADKVATNQAATATNQATTAVNIANPAASAAAAHNNMPPYIVGRWIVKAAYTGAEINPANSHVHAITDVTGLRTELDALKTIVVGTIAYSPNYHGAPSSIGRMPLKLTKEGDGRVHLRGSVSNALAQGSWGDFSQIFIGSVPVGWRPAGLVIQTAMINSNGDFIAPVRVWVAGEATGHAEAGSSGDIYWQAISAHTYPTSKPVDQFQVDGFDLSWVPVA